MLERVTDGFATINTDILRNVILISELLAVSDDVKVRFTVVSIGLLLCYPEYFKPIADICLDYHFSSE